LNVALIEDAEVLLQIKAVFQRRRRLLPVNFEAIARIQARVPAGATVLRNEHGSAPGLVVPLPPRPGTTAGRRLIMLPGPPRELQPMFINLVVPLLRSTFPDCGSFVSTTFHTIGMGESRVEETLQPHLASLEARGIEIGFCARTGEVDVRLSATGPGAGELVNEAGDRVRELLGNIIYGRDGGSLEAAVVNLLRERKQSLVTAESCTGGYVAHCLTNVPGASEVFVGGLVTYSNDLKRQLLGVSAETLEVHGAVSEATVREMATGARARHQADFAIAITGIAGPDGGTPDKPVGTVFIGLAHADDVEVQRHQNANDRETFKYITTRQSLETLRRQLMPAASRT
jgi:nicotinamide-nucleotide amidase